ncbi:11380_t:CDS:1, partial [Acaulospora morrowiae]
EKYIPLGSWGGKLGSMYLENVKWAMKNFGKIVNSLGWSEEKYERRINSVVHEIELKGN